MMPPLVLTPFPSAVGVLTRRLTADGWSTHRGFAIATVDWSLPGERIVCHGIVAAMDEAAAAALVAARGAGVVASVSDAGILARLFDDLCRIGETRIHIDPILDLPADQVRAMNLLCDGASLAEIASALHWSPRTVTRRVAAIRAALGVRTTAEAVARWRATTG
jgi:DNA-binding NarL/FixJ family response regulator